MSSLLAAKPGDCLLLHATDSAPRNLAYAKKAGFESRELYVQARRAELLEAMAVAGIRPEQCLESPIADQDAVRQIPQIAGRVRDLIQEWRPARVYTHAYEGGHPDHDAVARAVHLASSVPVWEFAGYHLRDGEYEVMRFLPGGGQEEAVSLDAAERARKRAMFECFRSQRRVLSRFPVDEERFREAPAYDFGQPPHSGPLYYETRDLGWTWREASAYFKVR
ncbi:MAG: PIG-L family deacetylase [Acidobacteria bacterium]|nr:PIG-L family deacetylase [Acidobacteriota bacterium]MBI3471888.1 PIG-L family deacetylase [Candidatus Solibacter usitatus]